jgi:hypothetical protein
MGQTSSSPAMKRVRCQNFARTADVDARPWALSTLYGVPRSQTARAFGSYSETNALEDIAACAHGSERLPHRAKVVRAARGARALVHRALAVVHGFGADDVQPALDAGLRYTVDHAREDMRRRTAKMPARYVVNKSAGEVFDTAEGNSLVQLLSPTSATGILPFDRPSARRSSARRSSARRVTK